MSSGNLADRSEVLRVAAGDLEGALSELDRRLAEAPSVEVFGRKASLLRKVGRLDEALAAADEAARRAAVAYGQALCERGRVRVEQGLRERARGEFARAAEVAPELADARVGLGSLALHAGDAPQAEAFFEAALSREPSARAYSGLGLARVALRRPHDALASFDRALDLEPDAASALYGLVQAAFQTGELERAERRVKRFLELHPANLDMLFTAAGLRVALGWLEPARELIERIELFAPQYAGLAELRSKLEAA